MKNKGRIPALFALVAAMILFVSRVNVAKKTFQVLSKAVGGVLRVIDNIIDKLIGK